MKNKKTKFFAEIFFSVLLFAGFFGITFGQSAGNTATTTATTTPTEFLPDTTNEAQMTADRNARLQMIQQTLKGLLPDKTLNDFTSQQENTTTTNVTPATNTTNTSSSVVVFTKNLKVGDTDSQVLLLQKALNADSTTIIATSGAGSPGNETTYFGQKTKLAVIKFQNKYASDILIPNGLTAGTGYFGASTRLFMNNLQKKNNISGTSKSTGISNTTTVPSGTVVGLGETVKINSITPNHGKNGTVVTITGSGMMKTANKIIAGGTEVLNAKSEDGKTIVFTVTGLPALVANPELSAEQNLYITEHFNELKTSDFPVMKYPICVVNDTGMSNCAFFVLDT